MDIKRTANQAFKTAYRKGEYARVVGQPRTACPYKDHRGACGAVTFSRAFRTAWTEGWDEKDGEMRRG